MSAYYNEFDKGAAAWLRELIADGQIAPGDVDERSIVDVSPADLRGYAQHHFFAGIGGWSLALRLAGVPDDYRIATASLPCQPFSIAGLGRGVDDARHLWPVFVELVRECGFPVIAGEQVASPAGRRWLSGVRADLEGMAYAVGAADLCAAGVRAPHIRQRLYWLAYSERVRREMALFNNTSGGAARSVGQASLIGVRGDADGVGHSDCRRWSPGHSPAATARHGSPAVAASRAVDGMDDAKRTRLEGLARHVHDGDEPGRLDALAARSAAAAGRAMPWDDFDLAHLTDGTARRIEPGAFPLAHGVPGRMGRLRGYGNAIVPEVAATFLTAAMGCLL